MSGGFCRIGTFYLKLYVDEGNENVFAWSSYILVLRGCDVNWNVHGSVKFNFGDGNSLEDIR